MKPKLPLPEPLRGAEIGTFAHNTVTVRMPNIARRTLAENDFPPDVVARIEALIDEIDNGRIRPLTDKNDWDEFTAVYEGQDWLTPPWFFVETYFYRRVLEATGYFGAGALAGVDPFAVQKQKGLTTTMPATRALAARLDEWLAQGWHESTFANLLAIDLWGNQADLSLWPTDAGEKPDHTDHASQQEHLLSDDTTAVTHYLTTRLSDYPTTRLDFLIDNAGFELIGDLALADYMLSSGAIQTVRFHLKIHPTFVSDATIGDVQATIAYLQGDEDEPVHEFGDRLAGLVGNGRFQLHTHPFWTSPLAGWEILADLHTELAAATLIISKGDANYRRLLGDLHWSYTTPFSDVVSYLPTPLVALRTLKSDVLIGLQPGQQAQLDQKDPDWLVNGRWGLIQAVIGNPITGH
ncbi:MAG: protein-glutamate O-methyltransferase family protein [Ardenticatenaceae bacterium]|nr:protein-glutamate O-methyltransferase family protein [Ardenticatenaceae bacterium]